MKQNILIDSIIWDMKIADDEQAILFVTDKGNVVARADGDCCSYTWIEHIELVSFPAKVMNVEDIDMPNLSSSEEEEQSGDYIEYYGCKITTDKGHIIIDYRNSSNGYYGGFLVWPGDDYFYGGVFKQNVSKENWVEIKK